MRGMERLRLIKRAGLCGIIVRDSGSRARRAELPGSGTDDRQHSPIVVEPRGSTATQPCGMGSLFDALLGDLKAYAKAESESDRLESLDRIYQISNVLGTVPWSPAATLREEIRQWLRPRLRVASATRQLSDTVTALPATTDPNVQSNRRGGSISRKMSWAVHFAITMPPTPSPSARRPSTAFMSR